MRINVVLCSFLVLIPFQYSSAANQNCDLAMTGKSLERIVADNKVRMEKLVKKMREIIVTNLNVEESELKTIEAIRTRIMDIGESHSGYGIAIGAAEAYKQLEDATNANTTFAEINNSTSYNFEADLAGAGLLPTPVELIITGNVVSSSIPRHRDSADELYELYTKHQLLKTQIGNARKQLDFINITQEF